jgi:hypothetical protein
MNKFYLFLGCFLFILNGCGNSAQENAIEKMIEKETGATTEVDLSQKGMKITGESEGEKYSVTTGDATEIPKGFPEDVPLYKPSKALGAAAVDSGYSVSLTTGDDIDKVASEYRKQMVSRGWSELSSMNIGGQRMLVYEKEGRATNIGIMSVEGETRITVTVAME